MSKSALQTMMRRLGGLSAIQQLDRVYENMRPCYRRYISRDGLNGIEDLIYRVTEHEEIELAEKEYNSRISKKQGGTRSIENKESDTAMISPSYKSNECCWNCGQRGHRKLDCRQPFRKFCSACGKTGVLTRECHPPGNGQPAGEKTE